MNQKQQRKAAEAFAPETPFIKPMLAHREQDAKVDRRRLVAAKYVAEPKMDGERVQLHVVDGKIAHVYTRTGRDIVTDKRLGWLRFTRWAVGSAVLDGEAYTGGGTHVQDRIGQQSGAPYSVALFDILMLDGDSLLRRTWTERRKALESITLPDARIAVVPTSDDWRDMWAGWVDQFGGEGVMVKSRDSVYSPGARSPHWIKLKVEITVDVVICGVTEKATYRPGGYKSGEVALEYGYWNEAKGEVVAVGQGLRVGARTELLPLVGQVAEVLCNGIGPDGSLRHGRLVRFRDDKSPQECIR